MNPQWLPPIINLNGDWSEKIKELYQIFAQDFIIQPKPTIFGLPIWINNRKLDDSPYEEGFWHLVTRTEESLGMRLPDFKRAARLCWCLPLIHNHDDSQVLCWRYDHLDRKGIRTYIWLKELDYVVILEERPKRNHVYLHTAFHVDGKSMRRSLEKKYEKRIEKTSAAISDGTASPSTHGR